VDHGLAGLDKGGEVENAVEGSTLIVGGDEKVFKRSTVSHFALNEFDAGRKQIAPPMAEIVKNYGLVSFFGQQACNCTAYIPRAASN
jgi:hypothetical protein